jgi:amidase
VPVTIKESFAYRGSPNTWGLPPLKNAISPRTAVAVERLESAGAIVLGKTNVSTMLADWQSYNPVYGVSNNPWDLTLTPGGSTGGGAAALAAGLGCLTIGSDLMGSVRIPAHLCGVYTHKPSLGLVSTAGFQPGPWDGSPGYPMDLSVMGPLARSAADLALTLSVLGGANGDEVKAWTWRLPATRHTRLKDFRVGYVFDDPASPLAPEVRSVYENALSSLSNSGARIDRGWPAGVNAHAYMKTLTYLLLALVTAEMPDDARESLRHRLQGSPEDVFAAAATAPHARWLHQTQDPTRLPRVVAEVLRDSRRLLDADHLHCGVPARPQRTDGTARYRHGRGQTLLRAGPPFLDQICNLGRAACHRRAGRTNQGRSSGGPANHRADVGRRNPD